MGESPRQAAALNRERLYFALSYKRLDRGHFVWPRFREPGETVLLSPAQLAMLIEGIDWRHPERVWRPTRAG
jgi:transposase